MSKDLMIDLETLGTKAGCVILSIGAVPFDIETGKISKEVFYQAINIQSCIDAGLFVMGDTIEWWMKQSEEARNAFLLANKKNLGETLHEFRLYLQKLGTRDLMIWGNSNRFDLGALDAAYKAVNREFPWYFRNERDVRTLVGFAPDIKKNWEFKGELHDPIVDCINQIGYCSQIYKILKHA